MVLGLLFFLVPAVPVWSQNLSPNLSGFGTAALAAADRVAVTAEIIAAKGDKPAELRITARMLSGWHIYSITQKPGGPKPTRINLVDSNQYRLLGTFQANPPPVIHHYDFWPDLDVEEQEGAVTWSAPIEPTGSQGFQGIVISGDVKGQVCKDLCVNFTQSFEARQASGLLSSITETSTAPNGNASKSTKNTVNTYKTQYAMITGRVTPAKVEAGDRAQLTLTATLADGWHLYAYEKRAPRDPVRARPTLIVLNQRAALLAGDPRTDVPVISKPREAFPEYVDNFHHADITWTIDLEIPENARSGRHVLSGIVGFMACNDAGTLCDLPQAASFAVDIGVGQPAGGTAPLSFSPASYTEAASAAEAAPPWDLVIPQAAPATVGTLLINMGWALLAGILLNVMPCVLPVIGLKIMSFVQQAGESRLRIFMLNVTFSAGIIFVFLVLALLAAFAGLAWAEQFQDPRFGIAMAGLVFVFALSLLGIWEIPIPGFVGSGTAQSIAEREGLAGAFFKGVLTTLLATPCVGPFMFTGLTFAAEQHSPAITLAIFGAMGCGMAIPFLLIGAFPAWIRFLPQPGGWMESFKHLMGFVLLATVVWIFYSFIPERYVVASLGLLFGLWLACWWANRTPMTAAWADRLYAWAVAVVLAVCAGYASFALLTTELATGAPDQSTHLALGHPQSGDWQVFTPATLDRLREQGSTVLVDFTADG